MKEVTGWVERGPDDQPLLEEDTCGDACHLIYPRGLPQRNIREQRCRLQPIREGMEIEGDTWEKSKAEAFLHQHPCKRYRLIVLDGGK